jgi:5'-nucleotidase
MPTRILFCLLLAALAAGPAPARADEASPRDAAALTILHINDVYILEPTDGGKAGGMARVASLRRQLAEKRPTLLTIGGDFLSPSVASSIFKGKQMVEGLNAAGLDVATLGNHEFDFGPEVLRERMREAKFQWVVSNVTDKATGRPIGGAAPFLVRRYGEVKVGFLGLLLTGEEISRDKLEGVRIEDPLRAAARCLRELRRQKPDLIVALTHLDFADDRRLAARFPQIDLILGGHEHFNITALVNRTLIAKADSDARTAVRIDVTKPKGGPIGLHYELVPITDALPDDPPTAKVAADYEARLDKELDVAVGSTAVPLDAVSERLRAGEVALGNLVADACRAAVQADLAIIGAGSIRSDRVYPPGRLTRRDLVAIHPFGSVVVKVEVTGETVLKALNNGVGRLGEAVGRFPQVSGLRFRVDPAAPAGDRVRDALVNGEPLDPKRKYTVATSDYQLKGGDGYAMFAEGRVLVGPEQGDLMVTALENLVRQQGEVAPKVEGRIRIGGAGARLRRPRDRFAARTGRLRRAAGAIYEPARSGQPVPQRVIARRGSGLACPPYGGLALAACAHSLPQRASPQRPPVTLPLCGAGCVFARTGEAAAPTRTSLGGRL